MNDDEVQALVSALAPVIKGYVKKQLFDVEKVTSELFTAFNGLLEPLRARVAALENQGIKYCGTYQRAQSYSKGNVVTDQGSAWIALGDCEGVRPGDGTTWQLMVKAGRDAR